MGMIVEEEATGTPAPLIPNDTRRSNVNQTSSRGENCVFPPSRTFVIPCPSEILLTRLFSLPSLSISFGRWRNDPKSRSSPTTVCVIRGYIRRIKVDETWFRARNRSIRIDFSPPHFVQSPYAGNCNTLGREKVVVEEKTRWWILPLIRRVDMPRGYLVACYTR